VAGGEEAYCCFHSFGILSSRGKEEQEEEEEEEECIQNLTRARPTPDNRFHLKIYEGEDGSAVGLGVEGWG
jgi:hypothetical protein